MAILTVSRQIASLGDELCKSIAEHLNYKFVSRKEIEQKILDSGFSKSKLKKFDEIKPGFLSSLTSDRDEYLDYLQLAVLESAAADNCVIIGRGSFIILKNLPNHISLKFVADNDLRISRYQAEHKCSKKQAEKIINESDSNRDGFNKSFFDFDINNPAMFHLVINTGLLDAESISLSVETLVKTSINDGKTLAGNKMIQEQLLNQKIVNLLKYKNALHIKFFRTKIQDKKILIYGSAETRQEINFALQALQNEFPDYETVSFLSQSS